MNMVLPAALLFLLTICVFAPLNVFIYNQGELSLGFGDVLVACLAAAAIFALPLIGSVYLFKGRSRDQAISLLIALSALVWLEGNIFVWQYGPLDGRQIDWSKQWMCGAIDCSVWCLVLILSAIKAPVIARLAGRAAIWLLAVQLISTGVNAVLIRGCPSEFKQYDLDQAQKFDLSKEGNVILIVLDEFQSDIFREAIEHDTELAKNYDGFVYFRNATGAFNITELALPAIMTGEFYDNTETRWDFLKRVFLEHSILKSLAEQRYKVELYPFKEWAHRMLYLDPSICSNLKPLQVSLKKKLYELDRVLRLALFRYLPHDLKRYVYNDRFNPLYMEAPAEGQGKIIHPDVEFVETAKRAMRAVGGNKRFKYYHLFAMHPPLWSGEDGKYVQDLAYTRKNAVLQAKAYIKLCCDLFLTLKEKGVYDNSLIIVIGDHGCGRYVDFHLNPIYDKRNDAINKRSPWHDFQGVRARGIPLVMVKRLGAHGPLITSEAPVSLFDIPATICGELGIKDGFQGESFFDISDTSVRARYYGASEWIEQPGGFFNPITKYKITGHSWSNQSWEVDSLLYPEHK